MHTMAKRLFSGLVGLLFCVIAAVPVLAENQGAAWATVQGRQALVYLRGAAPDAEFTCQIGNVPVTPAQVQQIQSLAAPVHTTILVDNSISIPSSQRPLVLDILEAVVGNRLQGEQFSVATISDTVNWLCEAQTDYLQVKSALDSITYNDQETRQTDCLYNVITHLQQQYPGQFCRIILVTDGVDNQKIGYTREELTVLIQQAGYPIYAIGCTNASANGNQELQQLFALSRLTSGQSFYLAENQDVNSIAAGIAEWNTGVQLSFDLPADLCDGAAHQMQIVSGDTTYTFSLTTSFGTVVAATEEPAPSTPVPTSTPAPTATPQPEMSESTFPVWGILLLAGGAVVIAVIAAVVIVRKIRGRTALGQGTAGSSPAAEENPTDVPTELLDLQNQDAPPTSTPWDNGRGATLQLRITDINNPLHTFQNPLQEGTPLILGRDPTRCQILIDYEPSVSRVQCEISLKDGEVWLHNLSQANITHVNGQRMEGICRLQSGSTLKMGRLLMKVEYQP